MAAFVCAFEGLVLRNSRMQSAFVAKLQQSLQNFRLHNVVTVSCKTILAMSVLSWYYLSILLGFG